MHFVVDYLPNSVISRCCSFTGGGLHILVPRAVGNSDITPNLAIATRQSRCHLHGRHVWASIAGGAHPLTGRRALCWWNPRPVKQPYQYRCLHLRPTRLTDLPDAGLVQQVRHQSHR